MEFYDPFSKITQINKSNKRAQVFWNIGAMKSGGKRWQKRAVRRREETEENKRRGEKKTYASALKRSGEINMR